ncbi:protein Cep78 homolog [Uranotaenia lowii]|uniref:protein Cep78 homolog n=1 Tax=Uranotaenia lowii TaxID=190385 RepID=UPI00247B0F70|nr:protein Cep78 homolog [Uranotaenia lowii]
MIPQKPSPEDAETESAAIGRKRSNARNKDFHRHYLALCRARNFQPLAELTSGGKRKSSKNLLGIDFFGDRFKETDWQLISDALVQDTSLELVAIRLRKVICDVLENGSQRASDSVVDRPSLLTKRLFTRLMEALAHFLSQNQKVRVFMLEALPIQGIFMATLINGLQQNYSITELSLARSAIRDGGCEAICAAVMHLPKIETLNLSGCQLTPRGCLAVAELVKYQKIQRFAESWQCSLRYRSIDTSKMQGLRYLLLNSNPCIGDDGLQEITEVLKDDEWIRQVHFRNCGLTDKGAKFLVDCLNINKTIEKFDIRTNAGISKEACREILVKLGVEVESSDSSQSLKDSLIEGAPRMKPSEQIKYLQQQLNAERLRCTQLQMMVEQMHLQQTECLVQLNQMKQEFNLVVTERDTLLKFMQRMDKPRPKSRKSTIRKSKSEALPSALFSRSMNMRPNSGSSRNNGSKSEMTLRWIKNRQQTGLTKKNTGSMKHFNIIERAIGDGSLNPAQLDDIAELNEELNSVHHKKINEEGFGDVGMVKKVSLQRREVNVTQITDGKDDTSVEHFFHSIDKSTHDFSPENRSEDEKLSDCLSLSSSCDEERSDEDIEADESVNSISGADLLQMIVKKRLVEQSNDAQSLFMSAYSGNEC